MPTPKTCRAIDCGFTTGEAVRYRPGTGTYGYEDALGDDGRVPGVVVGFTPTRIRVRLTLPWGATVRAVDAASLTREARGGAR